MQRGAHTARLRAEEEETGVWVKLSKVQQRLVIRSLMFFCKCLFLCVLGLLGFFGGFKSLIFCPIYFVKLIKVFLRILVASVKLYAVYFL